MNKVFSNFFVCRFEYHKLHLTDTLGQFISSNPFSKKCQVSIYVPVHILSDFSDKEHISVIGKVMRCAELNYFMKVIDKLYKKKSS